MKKLVLCTIMLLFVISAAGCKKEEKILTADEVSANTILARADGRLQVATVEDFDKAYYTLAGLEEFVANQVNSYNQSAGGEKITIDNVEINNSGKAVMLLSYSGMDQYSNFNKVQAAYFNGGIEDNPLEMPATLKNVKDGSAANTNDVIKNTKYKVLVMYEPYNIIVDGSVKYYSDNATLVDKNTVQSTGDGMTVVVFKP